MSVLDQAQSSPAVPLPMLDIHQSVMAYTRQYKTFRILGDGNSVEIANHLVQYAQTGVIDTDGDPYMKPDDYNEAFEGGEEDVSYSRLVELMDNLSDDDLKKSITPLWIYLRTRIVTQYDGGSLVDQRTGDEVNPEGVRPPKSEVLDNRNFSSLFNSDLMYRDSDGDNTFDGWEITSSRVLLLPEGGSLSDPFIGFYINPGDPYRAGAPSPRSIAMNIVDELDRSDRLIHMSILIFALTAIQAHPQRDSLVMEDGSSGGFHLWPIGK